MMTEARTSRCYDVWSGIYDWTFGKLVHKRQLRAVEQLQATPGQRILDLGVGTGMTLRHYGSDVMVVGLDLSPGMLAEAAMKVHVDGLGNCGLVQADAMLPPFGDHSFDHVMISHTISVVSDPVKLLRWARRLVKPGGRIVVLNHFQSPHALIAWFERLITPLSTKVGWRSDLSLEACLAQVDLHVQYRFKMSLLDFWQIVVLSEHRAGLTRSEEVCLPPQPRMGTGLAVEGR